MTRKQRKAGREVMNLILTDFKKFLRLEKHGNNYFGPCPFHRSTKYVLVINPDKFLYHCFDCGNGGSIVSLLSKINIICREQIYGKGA